MLKKIAISGNESQGDHLDELRHFFAALSRTAVEVCIERDFRSYLEGCGIDVAQSRAVESLPDGTALAISLGGDGTFLRTAAWLRGATVPVLGVNTGHLGYLTPYTLRDLPALMAGIEGDYEVSQRITLQIESTYLPVDFYPVALNEVAVSKGDTTSMVSIQAMVDDHYLADYLADGLIVSTPTGSTAYNLSCGGPILAPTLECITLAPIAPHSLTLRPLVMSAGSELHLKVSSRGAEECHVGVDGRTFAVPASGADITIRKSDHAIYVAQPRGSFFAEVLRNKLRWGEGPLTGPDETR